jgi:hypothetical protein
MKDKMVSVFTLLKFRQKVFNFLNLKMHLAAAAEEATTITSEAAGQAGRPARGPQAQELDLRVVE